MQKMRLMILALVALVAALMSAPKVYADPLSVKLSEKTTMILPLQIVSGVQLYSPEEGKGFPGVETVLLQRLTWRLSVGAAPILGTDVNVPFASVATKLSPKFFDTSNNDLYFGVWAGKPSNGKHVIFGVSASVALW
jgi:hypothetical protein